jgi:hypothetical protein
LAPLSAELGLHVCGGRGKHSRATPGELVTVGERVGLDGAALARASRLVAKVDSAAVQDGFDLYLHGFIVADDGRWVVVQQGMNGERRQARRYHWLSEGLESFVDAPHAAIEGQGQGIIVNLADRRAGASRDRQVDLLGDLGPDGISRELARIENAGVPAQAEAQPLLPHLIMPEHHDVRPEDVVSRRLHGALAAAADRGPEDFAELLLVPGIGAAPCGRSRWWRRWCTARPADQRPRAVLPRAWRQRPTPVSGTYASLRRTIEVMKSAVRKAKLGNEEELGAIRRLDEQARRLERATTGPSVEAVIAEERARSHEYGGRSVFGWEPPSDAPGDTARTGS